MADMLSILSKNYTTVGSMTQTAGKYVNVDPAAFQGTWSGKYANNKTFKMTISDVNGFRAKAKYESAGTVKFQDVLIKDNSFRIGDSKFTVTKANKAQIKTVVTDPVSGATNLDTAPATRS